MGVTALAATPLLDRRDRPTVSVAADSDAAAWEAFVSARGAAASCHAWAWRDVFAHAFGHEPIYLVARQAGRITGVLPLVYIRSRIFGRSLTSLPFLNYGGCLVESAEAASALLEAAADLSRSRRCGHVEFRHVAQQFPQLPCKQHKVTMLLPLGNARWEQLDRKVRNQIRKAQKSELICEHGGVELLDDFYRVFARNMRDLGTPVYGRRFFAEVLAAFPSRMSIDVVRRHGRAVAAGIAFRTAGTVEVPWASSIRDFNNLCPNHLLYWNVIERSMAEGADTVDFGRSTPNEGTYKFKEQWGAVATPLHWEYLLSGGSERLPNVSPTNPRFQLAIRLWQRLPLTVTTWIGPSIVRAIP